MSINRHHGELIVQIIFFMMPYTIADIWQRIYVLTITRFLDMSLKSE